ASSSTTRTRSRAAMPGGLATFVPGAARHETCFTGRPNMYTRVETLFEELKRYVQWGPEDATALRALHPRAAQDFVRIADVFYRRIIEHDEARKALEGGESQVGRLKIALEAWMDTLLAGPWDEVYYERRARIGRLHVRIGLPQHYMFGAMNILR